MFKKIFTELCNERGIAPTKACTDNGLSNAAYSCWNEKTVPRQATLFKFAKYFDVTVDYLLGKEDKKIPLGPIVEREEDELWAKITALDATDRIKVDAFVTGLLAADKYGTATEHTHQIKIAARGGGVKEITITDSQLQALLALPDVTDLGDADN
ncbi:MAG: helix-turn-helix transcriptional regulator [Clostridia bacterium]|nr:helix-turn-helix transcriptional regulator [Clostridia bacterium]